MDPLPNDDPAERHGSLEAICLLVAVDGPELLHGNSCGKATTQGPPVPPHKPPPCHSRGSAARSLPVPLHPRTPATFQRTQSCQPPGQTRSTPRWEATAGVGPVVLAVARRIPPKSTTTPTTSPRHGQTGFGTGKEERFRGTKTDRSGPHARGSDPSACTPGVRLRPAGAIDSRAPPYPPPMARLPSYKDTCPTTPVGLAIDASPVSGRPQDPGSVSRRFNP